MAEGRSPRSVARAVACVRGFYRFLSLDGHVSDEPGGRPAAAARLEGAAEVPRRSKTSIACCARRTSTTPRGLRDRALIELLYATGMRVSELVGCARPTFNLEAAYLTSTGKGDKQRIVPIGDEAAELGRAVYARGAAGAARPAHVPRLFVNARGGGPGSRASGSGRF